MLYVIGEYEIIVINLKNFQISEIEPPPDGTQSMEVTDDNIIISTIRRAFYCLYSTVILGRFEDNFKFIPSVNLLFFNRCDMFHHHPKPEELCLRE